jgi:hypothetical protein
MPKKEYRDVEPYAESGAPAALVMVLSFLVGIVSVIIILGAL